MGYALDGLRPGWATPWMGYALDGLRPGGLGAELAEGPAPAGRVEGPGHLGENLRRAPVGQPGPAGEGAYVRPGSARRGAAAGQEHRPFRASRGQPAQQLG